MGRKPHLAGSITRLRLRKRGKKVYYYYDQGGRPRKEISLGSDYALALRKYAELEQSRVADTQISQVLTFKYVGDLYMKEVVPTKAPATQRDNEREYQQLLLFFNNPPAPLEAIEPMHIKMYLRQRTGKSRANREKALLSHMWNWARECGYTKLANPCSGIKGNKEKGRDVYIEDDLYRLVYEHASDGLRDAMDLAYLAAQRVSDTLRMDIRHIRDGYLEVAQAKTAAKRRIEVTGELAALLDRIAARKAGLRYYTNRLVVNEAGQALTYSMLRKRFDDAREAAGVAKQDFQIRDLRAKGATDKADSEEDIRQAQRLLGHTSVAMTEKYTRNRRGTKITPTK
ncbi:integrase [Chitinimonas prasina]|uniref:Integrase n=1 Tax=Chitinimonas prasina TaxID=1434937 RepID=A0ABQ5YF01_9NEIS|nr:tyrosine-type recombinase/integrase [Chitinimonas prasina]GLR13299.1 integrase [Chitinimonas prasina]